MLSLESNEKLPLLVVIARAIPLLAMVPLCHPCTNEVMSTKTN
jgi:hypothetical protein